MITHVTKVTPEPTVPSYGQIFAQLQKADTEIVVGKGANLNELTSASFPVPDGYVTTAQPYLHATNAAGVRAELATGERAQNAKRTAALSNLLEKIGLGNEAPARRIHAIFGQPLTAGGVSHTLTELLDHMGKGLEPLVWIPQRAPGAPVRHYHRAVVPNLLYRAACKLGLPQSLLAWITAKVALRSVRPGDVVYLWPPYDSSLIKGAKRRGAVVVAERINCMGSTCRSVLTRAYAQLGRTLPDGWCTPEAIEEERAQMADCYFVTAPSAAVRTSLLGAGIPAERILDTAYGFNMQRLARGVRAERPERTPVFLFVGLGNVRKGLPMLLQAWERAGAPGELHLAGRIDDDVRALCARQLARTDVRELGYVDDIAQAYAAADVFVFPSHEEGGPQVIYEAAGCGLPSIVSPMGAGRLVRHRREGLVVDPLDECALADALRALGGDSHLRRALSAEARARAQEFTWQQAGQRLHDAILSAIERRAAGERAEAGRGRMLSHDGEVRS